MSKDKQTLEERAEARPPCGDCCFGGYCVDCMAAFAREELEALRDVFHDYLPELSSQENRVWREGVAAINHEFAARLGEADDA